MKQLLSTGVRTVVISSMELGSTDTLMALASTVTGMDHASVDWFNSHLVCDPTIRQPGFDLPRQQWSLLNCFRTELNSGLSRLHSVRMKVLFRGWPVMIDDTHTRRRSGLMMSGLECNCDIMKTKATCCMTRTRNKIAFPQSFHILSNTVPSYLCLYM